MSNADFHFQLQLMFLVFGSTIELFHLYFVFRMLRLLFASRRFHGIIARVHRSEGPGRLQYAYLVVYEHPSRGKRLAYESQHVPLQQFKVGDVVTLCVKDGEPPACEILSWAGVGTSVFVILPVMEAMMVDYQRFLGAQHA